jgi:hypothetical protein
MKNLIKVETITDHDDGSATLTLDMDAETYQKRVWFRIVMKGIESEEMRDD